MPAKYFESRAPASISPVIRKSIPRPVRSALRYISTVRPAKSISGMSVVIATFQELSGTSSTMVPAAQASRSSRPRRVATIAKAKITGTSRAGARSTTMCSEMAASAASHQPTIGGWS